MTRLNILIIDCSDSFCVKMKQMLLARKAFNEIKTTTVFNEIKTTTVFNEIKTTTVFNEIKTTTEISEGIALLESNPIDIVLLDIQSPGYGGKSALGAILTKLMLPVIMLAEPSVDQTTKTVTAMSNGAVDFIRKLDFVDKEKQSTYENEMIKKIMNVGSANRRRSIAKRIKVNPHTNEIQASSSTVKIVQQHNSFSKDILIAIGTSTGGPRALQQVIQQIPKDFQVPILIVQHMPKGFTKSLSARLNNIGNIHVKEATHGEVINKGVAYLAPGNFHMQVRRVNEHLTIELTQDNDHLSHRPSVDVLFKSIAQLEEYHKIAVVLTGMGKDGAMGVMKIKELEKEAVIIAESEETAVIDGMPKAVIETELVTDVIKIDEIGSTIVAYSRKKGELIWKHHNI